MMVTQKNFHCCHQTEENCFLYCGHKEKKDDWLINLIITLINLLLLLQILISLKPEVHKPDLFDDYRRFMEDFTR